MFDFVANSFVLRFVFYTFLRFHPNLQKCTYDINAGFVSTCTKIYDKGQYLNMSII